MKQYGNFNFIELENMYPFEFEINYFLTLGHLKKINDAKNKA